jgi:histidinol-phosphatase
MTTNSELLNAVHDVARVAGDLAMRYFATGLEVETKGDGSPVTRADREAEQAARAWITKRFPDDGIVGEEFGVHNPDARRRWYLDPIDGTRSFVLGVPLWGTLIAVAEGEDVIAGAIYCPAARDMTNAAIGEGCWWNGKRARVSSQADLSNALVLTTEETFCFAPTPATYTEPWSRLVRATGTRRTWGDCYGYMLVATGRADAMVDGTMSAWDSAALMPVITEAGGVFTDWRDRATGFGGNAIATNAALADAVRDILIPGRRSTS